jgi:hypothetical protein
MAAITKALAPAVASPEGRPKKGMMENPHHRRLKAGGIGPDAGKGDGHMGKVRPGPGHFDVHGGGPLPCPAPEPKPLSVSRSGFASSGPLRRTPFAPPPYPLGGPFRGRGGAVSGPESS